MRGSRKGPAVGRPRDVRDCGVDRKSRHPGNWAAGGSEGPRGNRLSDKCSFLVCRIGKGGGERMGRSGLAGSWGRLKVTGGGGREAEEKSGLQRKGQGSDDCVEGH